MGDWTMTPEDADQLYKWVRTLNSEQLRLLWRWITLEWLASWGYNGRVRAGTKDQGGTAG